MYNSCFPIAAATRKRRNRAIRCANGHCTCPTLPRTLADAPCSSSDDEAPPAPSAPVPTQLSAALRPNLQLHLKPSHRLPLPRRKRLLSKACSRAADALRTSLCSASRQIIWRQNDSHRIRCCRSKESDDAPMVAVATPAAAVQSRCCQRRRQHELSRSFRFVQAHSHRQAACSCRLAAKWPHAFSFSRAPLMLYDKTKKRLEIVDILCNCFRTIIRRSNPLDLLPAVYLSIGRLAPAHGRHREWLRRKHHHESAC